MDFIVRDFRKVGHFTIDNELIQKGWVKTLGRDAFAAYAVICQNANINDGTSKVSYQTIVTATGMSKRQAILSVQRLEACQFIHVGDNRKGGRGKTNEIIVLDKSHWIDAPKKDVEATKADASADPSVTPESETVQEMHSLQNSAGHTPFTQKGANGDQKRVQKTTRSYIRSKLLSSETTTTPQPTNSDMQSPKSEDVVVDAALETLKNDPVVKLLAWGAKTVPVNCIRLMREQQTTLAELFRAVTYIAQKPDIRNPSGYLRTPELFDGGKFVYDTQRADLDLPKLYAWANAHAADVFPQLVSKLSDRLINTLMSGSKADKKALWLHPEFQNAVAAVYRTHETTTHAAHR